MRVAEGDPQRPSDEERALLFSQWIRNNRNIGLRHPIVGFARHEASAA
jgi:hypothetical protein